MFSIGTEWIEAVEVIIIEPRDWTFPVKGTSRSFQRTIARAEFELLISGENLVSIRLPAQTGEAPR